MFDRARTQRESFGDVAIRQAPRDELGHFVFAFGEFVARVARLRIGSMLAVEGVGQALPGRVRRLVR